MLYSYYCYSQNLILRFKKFEYLRDLTNQYEVGQQQTSWFFEP